MCVSQLFGSLMSDSRGFKCGSIYSMERVYEGLLLVIEGVHGSSESVCRKTNYKCYQRVPSTLIGVKVNSFDSDSFLVTSFSMSGELRVSVQGTQMFRM